MNSGLDVLNRIQRETGNVGLQSPLWEEAMEATDISRSVRRDLRVKRARERTAKNIRKGVSQDDRAKGSGRGRRSRSCWPPWEPPEGSFWNRVRSEQVLQEAMMQTLTYLFGSGHKKILSDIVKAMSVKWWD